MPDPKTFAEAIESGETIEKAMLQAGYSPKSARQGKQRLSRAMLQAVYEQGLELAGIGEKLDAAHVEKAIAGQLYTNMITGESKGNEAAKLLGSMVKFGAFKSDQNTNVIILQNDQRADQIAPDHIINQPEPQRLSPADVE